MKRFSDRQQLTTLAELNITPLLDLAFVLLIIFMLTTPLMENSSKLILPTHQGAAGATGPEETLQISVDHDMQVMVEGKTVSVEAMKTEVATLLQQQPQLAVRIRADKRLTMQQFHDVAQAVKRAGVTKVGLDGVVSGE